MKTINQYNNSENVSNFVMKLFEARQTAHFLHLKTRSYAEHKALQGFYDGMNDLIDDFVETYQGQFGLLSYSTSMNVDEDANPVKMMVELTETIKEMHGKTKDTHLQNMLDEMTSLTYKTIYKLKYLK